MATSLRSMDYGYGAIFVRQRLLDGRLSVLPSVGVMLPFLPRYRGVFGKESFPTGGI